MGQNVHQRVLRYVACSLLHNRSLCFVFRWEASRDDKKNVVEQSNSVVSPNGNQVSTMSFGNGQHCQIFQKSFFFPKHKLSTLSSNLMHRGKEKKKQRENITLLFVMSLQVFLYPG